MTGKMCPFALIYKLTYQNNKIYIGCDYFSDRKSNVNQTYFGSPQNPSLAKELSISKVGDTLTVKKEILGIYENISLTELRANEDRFIVELESNNPVKGYNMLPKFYG